MAEGVLAPGLWPARQLFLRRINTLMFFSIMHATIAVRHTFLDPDGAW
jgi:hypothetical protein